MKPSLPRISIGQSSLVENSTANLNKNSSLTFFKQRFNPHSIKEQNFSKRIDELKSKFNIQRFVVSPANKNRESAFPQKRVQFFINQAEEEMKNQIAENRFNASSSDFLQLTQTQSFQTLPQNYAINRKMSQHEINYKAIQIKNPSRLLRQKQGQFSQSPLMTMFQQTQPSQSINMDSTLKVKKCTNTNQDPRSPFKRIVTQHIENISNLKQMLINPFMDMTDLKYTLMKGSKNNSGLTSPIKRNRMQLKRVITLNQEKLIKRLYDKCHLIEARKNYRTIHGRVKVLADSFFVRIKAPYVKVYDPKNGRMIKYYLDLSTMLNYLQNGIENWHQIVKSSIDHFYQQIDSQNTDIFQIKFKIKNNTIFPIQSKQMDQIQENFLKKSYLILKQMGISGSTIITYKNFCYQLNDETGVQIGLLEVPFQYVQEMLKYQRFQGNLTEKVGQCLELNFDEDKKVFNVSCDFEKVQTDQIGEAFFKSVSINKYFSQDSVFIPFEQNQRQFHLMLKPSTIKYVGTTGIQLDRKSTSSIHNIMTQSKDQGSSSISLNQEVLVEMKFDQLHKVSKENFVNWESHIVKFKVK
eukprot:403350311